MWHLAPKNLYILHGDVQISFYNLQQGIGGGYQQYFHQHAPDGNFLSTWTKIVARVGSGSMRIRAPRPESRVHA